MAKARAQPGDRHRTTAVNLLEKVYDASSSGLDLPNLKQIRGDLIIILNYLETCPPAKWKGRLRFHSRKLKELVKEYILLLIEIRTMIKSKDYNEFARTFSLGKDALLVMSDLSKLEKINLPEELLSGLAVAGSYIANTGYVASAVEALNIFFERSLVDMEEHFLELVTDSDPRISRDPKKMQKSLDQIVDFLEQANGEGVLAAEKLSALIQGYASLVHARIALIRKDIENT